MIESLQTARLIHRLLIGVCAVGLVFALSPNREVSLQDALEEIDELESLLAKDNDSKTYFIVNKVMKAINREVSSHPFFANMEQMVRRLGLSHSSYTFEAFTVNSEAHTNAFNSRDWNNERLFHAIPTVSFTGINNASLEQLEEFFFSKFVFESLVPDSASDFAAQFETQLEARMDSAQLSSDDRRFFAMSFHIHPRNAVETEIPVREANEAKVQYRFDVKFIDEIASTVWGNSSFGPYNSIFEKLLNSKPLNVDVMSSELSNLSYKAPPTSSWSLYSVSKTPVGVLREDSDFRALVTSEGDKVVFLPAVQKYWNELRGKSLSAAREELKRQQRSNSEDLTLLGLSVPVDLVVWAYPLALLFVVLYLFLHMRHAMRLAVQNTEPLREFPWIILFSGRFEWIVKYASVALLPTFAAVLVLLRNWSVTDYKWVGILLTLLTLMFCLFVANTVRSLNKQRQNAA